MKTDTVMSSGGLKGYLDATLVSNDTVMLVGWAADMESFEPADSVVVFLNGSFLALGRTGSERVDLVEGYGKSDLRRAGFRYAFPLHVFRDLPEPDVRLFALSSDGSAVELEHTPGVSWPAP